MRFIAISALLIGLGCSSQAPANASCPNDLPAACTTAPSYASEVAPIVSAHCLKCHSKGGVEESVPLDGYSAIFARRTTVLTQVYSCKMPQEGEPALSADERAKLLMWLVCKAPNN
ncbi:MAG: hypothetical protein ACXWUG_16175 [Polyangiales bacterium]